MHLGGSMKLTIKQSKIGCYQIVEYQDKKFIMDLSTLKPKFYYWGFLPKTVMLEMIEIEKSNSQFELDNEKKMSFSTAVITIMVQPFVKIGYDLFKNVFVNYDINSQIVIKIILFLLSMSIAYFIVLQSLRKAHSKAQILLDKNPGDYKIIFHSNNRRNPVNSIIFLGNIILFAFYIYINNGVEAGFLVMNCIWSILLFLASWTMPPVAHSYQNKYLIFKEISKK